MFDLDAGPRLADLILLLPAVEQPDIDAVLPENPLGIYLEAMRVLQIGYRAITCGIGTER